MRLLAFTDFSIRVLMRLAAVPEQHFSTEVLSRELNISRHHLQKIVQELTALGVVRTLRGVKGGVMLARPPDEIKIGNIVQTLERGQSIVECFRNDGGKCPVMAGCCLHSILCEAQKAFYSALDPVTLADLCSEYFSTLWNCESRVSAAG